MKTNKLRLIFYFILFYGLFCFLSLNRHSRSKTFTYHSELWADKAGYNVYLPSLFIYNFNANEFPNTMDVKTGNGFKLDTITGKVITKYPIGVALLESPFWITAHLFSQSKDGYSKLYQKSIDFSGSFYLTLGMFFLFFSFKKKCSIRIPIILLIILSSGIFYYGIFETGMSHIYSFACLACIIFLLLNKSHINPKFYLLYIVIPSLLYIIIRPVNGLMLMSLFIGFIYVNNEAYFNIHVLKSITIQQLLLIFLIATIIIFPQLYYYKYAFGNFFAKSYQNESFQTPTPNRIFELLFSPHNGLLIYYPVGLFILLYNLFTKNKFKGLFLFVFISYVLIYASWWSLSLGCSFGHRTFNDVILIFFIPIFLNPDTIKKYVFWVMLIFSLINFKFIFSYDSCLYSSEKWNYNEYKAILFGEFK